MTVLSHVHREEFQQVAGMLDGSEQQVEEEIGLFRAGHVVLNVLINDNQGSIQLFRVLHTGQGRVYDIHFPISQSKIQGVDTNGALLPAVEIAQALRKRSSIENNHVVDEILWVLLEQDGVQATGGSQVKRATIEGHYGDWSGFSHRLKRQKLFATP